VEGKGGSGGGDPTDAGPRHGGGGRWQRRSVVQGRGRGGMWWDPVAAREGGNRWRVGRPGERKKTRAMPKGIVIFYLFKMISNKYELFGLKGGPTKLQKFQIKYVFERN
jgi:hypothetical protein